ncbi:hypothetical protein Y032_0228g2868 [Ancylostoma ceylanicum]|nr:hypothetical protein Y032_0228g2868 [Ancylostoma ceylanicum]
MVYEHYNRPSRQDVTMFVIRHLTITSFLHHRARQNLSFQMIAILFLVASWIGVVSTGAVGECRSECVEQNLYKIVRVHLKDDFVMAGICRNTSVSAGALSTVIPFICNRHHGIWTLDTENSIQTTFEKDHQNLPNQKTCSITNSERGY